MWNVADAERILSCIQAENSVMLNKERISYGLTPQEHLYSVAGS